MAERRPRMDEKIEGKVAQILNVRELVINKGSDDGVKEGMTFAVLNRQAARIVDPDTKEDLVAVDIPKVLVRAVRVAPRLTVARTFVTHRSVTGGAIAANLFAPRVVHETVETLRLTERPDLEDLAEESSYVKIGDPVVRVLGEEYITDPEVTDTVLRDER